MWEHGINRRLSDFATAWSRTVAVICCVRFFVAHHALRKPPLEEFRRQEQHQRHSWSAAVLPAPALDHGRDGCSPYRRWLGLRARPRSSCRPDFPSSPAGPRGSGLIIVNKHKQSRRQQHQKKTKRHDRDRRVLQFCCTVTNKPPELPDWPKPTSFLGVLDSVNLEVKSLPVRYQTPAKRVLDWRQSSQRRKIPPRLCFAPDAGRARGAHCLEKRVHFCSFLCKPPAVKANETRILHEALRVGDSRCFARLFRQVTVCIHQATSVVRCSAGRTQG